MRLYALVERRVLLPGELPIVIGEAYAPVEFRDFAGRAFVRFEGDKPGRWHRLEHFSENAPAARPDSGRIA